MEQASTHGDGESRAGIPLMPRSADFVDECARLRHDLRNPLQGMVVGLELLRHVRDDPDTVLAVIQRLENSVRRMRALLDAEDRTVGRGPKPETLD